MSAVAGALISGGVNLLGGLFGRSSAKKQAAAEREMKRQDYLMSGEDARSAAIRGGFNPLTFLGATGGGPGAAGGYGGGAPPLASQELIVGGLQDFGRVLSGEAAQEQRERDLAYSLAKLEFEKSSAVGSGSNAASGFSTARRAAARVEQPGSVTAYRGGAPRARPSAETEGRSVVYAPNKMPLLVPNGILERLNIKPWKNMAMGEYTELVGELRGEGEGVLDLGLDIFGAGGVSDNMTGGDLYNAPGATPKKTRKPVLPSFNQSDYENW